MASGLTAAELRTSTEEELGSKLAEAKEELFNLRFQGATGQLESHGRLRAVRKEIARIYTVMRERELGIVVEFADEAAAGTEPVAVVDAGSTGGEEADASE
jgi:large subunit ribosomal protein L29